MTVFHLTTLYSTFLLCIHEAVQRKNPGGIGEVRQVIAAADAQRDRPGQQGCRRGVALTGIPIE